MAGVTGSGDVEKGGFHFGDVGLFGQLGQFLGLLTELVGKLDKGVAVLGIDVDGVEDLGDVACGGGHLGADAGDLAGAFVLFDDGGVGRAEGEGVSAEFVHDFLEAFAVDGVIRGGIGGFRRRLAGREHQGDDAGQEGGMERAIGVDGVWVHHQFLRIAGQNMSGKCDLIKA